MPFSPPQRSLLLQALQEAEERTMAYYFIPPFRWEQLRYDLITQKDQEWEPFPDPMLARVRCLQHIKPRRYFDFYRIELNDPGILAAAKREHLAKNLYPFFVYILTHEMIHIVRLSSILENGPEKVPACDKSEENRVQDISRRILTDSSFHSVFERFSEKSVVGD